VKTARPVALLILIVLTPMDPTAVDALKDTS